MRQQAVLFCLRHLLCSMVRLAWMRHRLANTQQSAYRQCVYGTVWEATHRVTSSACVQLVCLTRLCSSCCAGVGNHSHAQVPVEPIAGSQTDGECCVTRSNQLAQRVNLYCDVSSLDICCFSVSRCTCLFLEVCATCSVSLGTPGALVPDLLLHSLSRFSRLWM